MISVQVMLILVYTEVPKIILYNNHIVYYHCVYTLTHVLITAQQPQHRLLYPFKKEGGIKFKPTQNFFYLD